jgi:ABC-type lipopolysaccharide export system ATPase subunit
MRILESGGIYKNYFKKRVLAGIGMNIESGKIVGLLGPNGFCGYSFLCITGSY